MAQNILPRCGNQSKIEVVLKSLIGAGVLIEEGKIYVHVAGYLVVPGAGNATTGKRPVVALTTVDNTAGADGALSVDVTYDFMVDMPNDGTHPITQADVGVSPGYLSSAFTVSTNSADGPPIGSTSRPAIVSLNAANSLNGRPVRVELR